MGFLAASLDGGKVFPDLEQLSQLLQFPDRQSANIQSFIAGSGWEVMTYRVAPTRSRRSPQVVLWGLSSGESLEGGHHENPAQGARHLMHEII